ncbi:hypothetical protein DFJ64_1821 [Thermasporomyces composti]|uniref:Uncharacterized protein n=1 Tax=Thermasporomyces composti TaxID=696763 RepID=A0A3D9V6U0_THECX|nr:hypothetical protein DFJ64_1821 [Thermasporomyces composti]
MTARPLGERYQLIEAGEGDAFLAADRAYHRP